MGGPMGAPVAGETRIAIDSEDDIIAARQTAREVARDLGFGLVDQSRIATAVSELTRNVVRYAIRGHGEAVIRAIEETPSRVGLEVTVADEGPGIPNIEAAMSEGFTTGNGMGLGLPGAKRLVDEMNIQSVVGEGTTVVIRKWRR